MGSDPEPISVTFPPFTASRGVWDVNSLVEGWGTSRLGWFPTAGRFADDRKACQLVMTASENCLGVAGHGTSRLGGATTAVRGEKGGFTLCCCDFIPSKTALF